VFPLVPCIPCQSQASAHTGPVTSPPGKSSNPIRYANGEIRLVEDDLAASGMGHGWSHVRTWANQMSNFYDGPNGFNWISSDFPFVTPADANNQVYVMGDANNILSFTKTTQTVNGVSVDIFTANFDQKETLTHDTVNHVYRLARLDGSVTEFNEPNAAVYTSLFKQMIDVAGNVTAVTGYANGEIQTVERDCVVNGVASKQVLTYTYGTNAGDGNDNRLISLTLQSGPAADPLTNVFLVQYTYYPDGTLDTDGELQTVERFNWTNGQWQSLGTTYYHYQDTQPPGNEYQFSLKLVLGPKAYSDMVAAGLNPLTAWDSQLLVYADYFFEYDSQQRVTHEVVSRGSQSYQYAYTTSTNPDGYNSWKYKTVETLPDGNQNIVYANYAGAMMLKVFSSPPSQGGAGGGGSSSSSSSAAPPAQWYEFYRYDANGRIAFTATSSALSGFDETKADLVNYQGSTAQYLYTHAGLIRNFMYDANTGWIASETIQNGQWGLPIKLREYQYTSCCTNSSSSSSSSSPPSQGGAGGVGCLYFLAKLIEYPDDGSCTGSSSSSSSSSSASGPPSGFANANTRQIITTYAYTFWPGTCAVQQKTTTLPVIPASQNGSGVAATRQEYFDTFGNLIWSMDERGYITGMTYDIPTGALVQRIDDVDTTQVIAPAGWTTPAGGGLNLITDYQFDNQGRTTQVLGPVHTIDIDGVATSIRRANWTVYQDAMFQTWQGQGYGVMPSSPSPPSQGGGGGGPGVGGGLPTDPTSYYLINPVSITITDADGRITDQIQAVRTNSSSSSSSSSSSPPSQGGAGGVAVTSPGALSATDTFPQSSYVRWTTTQYSDCCFVASRRVYKLIPATGAGVSGTNYDETDFGYDVMKRQNRVVTPGGTITRTVFDALGRPIGTWVGTNDNGATSTDPTGGGASGNNMVQVTGLVYDNGLAGGDSNVTQQTAYVDATGTNDRVTTFLYDFRNRRTDTDGEIDFYQRVYYDNLDRTFQTDRYNTSPHSQGGGGGGGVGNLIGRSLASYDDRSAVFQTARYAVDPSTGIVGNALTDNTWRDAAGNVLKSFPAGSQLATKIVYDSLGRETAQYIGYNYSDTSYATATSVTGDTILKQVETTYDAASNIIQTNVRQRYHNTTGTGPLGSPSSAQPQARVTYVATYTDAIGRILAAANYGTNGGAALSRPSTIPASSNSCLVTSSTFNARAETYLSTDAAGTVTYHVFDDAERRMTLIENYIPTSISSSSSSSSNTCSASDDTNRTTNFTYTADGALATITAVNATTGNQTTTYEYATTLTNSAVASTLLKAFEIYPDSVSGSDQKAFTYNRQAQVTTLTDQNGTVHSFDYDNLGRQTADRVTTGGTGIDTVVLRIAKTYEARGLVQNITSYDNATVGAGNVVNDVQKAYNSFGQLVTDYQSHSGAVNVSTTPNVQYAYASGSANTIRPTSMTYPNGRVLHYDYGAGNAFNDATSLIASLIDNDGVMHLADYSYLGAGSIIQVSESQPGIQCTLIGIQGGNDPVTGDIYRGLDQFSRVKDLIWVPYGSSSSSSSSSSSTAGTNLVRIQHGYDLAGNRLSRKDLVAESYGTAFDELYSYDGLYRLKAVNRGTLNAGNSAITPGTVTFGQCWTLDATGNWKGFREDDTGSGIWNTVQNRSANTVNEITEISNSVGAAWTNPEYDSAGNMITLPQPASPSAAYTATYDAWNRAMTLVDPSSGNTVQINAYDGRNYRTIRNDFTAGVLSEERQYFYTTAWQSIEERVGESSSLDRQFVWGLRFLDDLVLRDRNTAGGTTLNERLFALQDPLSSVVTTVNPSGIVQERYAYSPYGAPGVLSSAFARQSATMFNWETLYAAYREDLATGLHLARERILNYAIGTWLNRDPSKSYDVSGLYTYVASEPIRRVDPSGLDRKLTIGGFDGQIIVEGTCCDAAPDPKKGREHRTQIKKSVTEACKCAKIILDQLTTQWNAFVKVHPPGGMWSKMVHAHRDFLIKTLRSIVKNCNQTITLICDAECDDTETERTLYTLRYKVIGPTGSIHVCPQYFDKPEAGPKLMMHEFGRYFGDIGDEDPNLGSNDSIDDWDTMFAVMCGQAEIDRLNKLQPPKAPRKPAVDVDTELGNDVNMGTGTITITPPK